eukprot:6554568-Ditylum_brightwellii.AAC.1
MCACAELAGLVDHCDHVLHKSSKVIPAHPTIHTLDLALQTDKGLFGIGIIVTSAVPFSCQP